MNIALVGYGKMGKMIEEVALGRGHNVALRIDENNQEDLNPASAAGVEVAIEFTAPHSAYANVVKCIDLGLPVVSGSTGWNQNLEEAKEHCRRKNSAFLHSSNFSIGVNIFFKVNEFLARLMAGQKEYDVTIKEIHHTQKKDAPSGTAVTLAEGVIQNLGRKKAWVKDAATTPEELAVISERIDPAPGTHYVKYTSAVDDIEIIHTAHNRQGFALGAVLAAEFLAGKRGVYTMDDVLQL